MQFLVLILLISKVAAKWDPKTHPRFNLLDHENCGESRIDRIVGGTRAAMGQYPWMAKLGYAMTKDSPPIFMCAGSLINRRYVLTAAHCLDSDMAPFSLSKILIGEHNRDSNCGKDCPPRPQMIRPQKAIVHERFNGETMQNDVALIRLSKLVKLNDYVTPICLPYGPLMNASNYPPFMEVAGWGAVNPEKKQMSNELNFIRLPLKDINICRKRMGNSMVTGNGQICAGGVLGIDSCGGDSGGPLMAPYAIKGSPKMFQFGLVSFGMTKCGSDSPAIYSDVRYFLNWILFNMAP